MFLPKPKPDVRYRRCLTSLLDAPGRHIRAAEINPDVRPQRALQPTAHIRMIENTIPHTRKQPLEIRTAKVRAGLEFGQGIVGGADGVEDDVSGGVEVEALGEVRVDLEELDAGRLRAGREGGGRGLRLERGEECLEPFERGRVAADPDELDAAETAGWVRSGAEVPDVFEDAGPWRDADAGADEDGDFVVEDVFGWGSVRSVDADSRHCLTVLECDLVHAHGIEAFELFGLEGAGAEGVSESAGKVADLSDVDGDVGVVRAGSDGEWVPLVAGDGGDVDKEPLSCFVPHGWFAELNLHCI